LLAKDSAWISKSIDNDSPLLILDELFLEVPCVFLISTEAVLCVCHSRWADISYSDDLVINLSISKSSVIRAQKPMIDTMQKSLMLLL